MELEANLQPYRRLPKPFAPDDFISESVKLNKIGHVFAALPADPGMPQQFVVSDFILDQSGFSGCNAKLPNVLTANLNDHRGYFFRLTPKGFGGINVNPILPTSSAYLHVSLFRQTPIAIQDVFETKVPSVEFSPAVGPLPNLTYSTFFVSQMSNGYFGFEIAAQVQSPFKFHDLLLRARYGRRSLLPAAAPYTPFGYDAPFGFPSTSKGPFIFFSYFTTRSVDPGPFVTLF